MYDTILLLNMHVKLNDKGNKSIAGLFKQTQHFALCLVSRPQPIQKVFPPCLIKLISRVNSIMR